MLYISQKLENDKLIHYNYPNYFKSINFFIKKLFFKNIYLLGGKIYKNLNELYFDTVTSYFDTLISLYDEFLNKDKKLLSHDFRNINPGKV